MPRNISKTVDQIARQALGKDWSIYAALLDHWQEIVGMEYAKQTTPVKITFPHKPTEQRRSGGTLHIKLPKGMAMEFTFKCEQIKQRINSYFGYDAIARIMLDAAYSTPDLPSAPREHDPEAFAQLQTDAKTIDNDELRAAFEALAEAALITRE
ncbi:MAG TPA: DciA family protein [Alphaproteobacteria bacterium]|nr:DciA family protein [Alphaproteobacteria bacterium]